MTLTLGEWMSLTREQKWCSGALEFLTKIAERLPEQCECDINTSGNGFARCDPHEAELLLDEWERLTKPSP